jgi:ATP-dependent helicase/nuclease subunit A
VALTEAQRRAVERIGQDVCVVAGPGSGKTTVLVARYAWLMEQQGIPPQRILAITFTEKAAADLKRRLRSRFAVAPGTPTPVDRAPVSTIHAFCAGVLREYAVEVGIDPEFAVLDEATAKGLARESADAALNALLDRDRALLTRLYECWDTPDPAGALTRALESWRLSGDPQPIAARCNLEDAIRLARDAVSSLPTRSKRQEELKTGLALWLRDPSTEPPDPGQMTGPLPDAVRELRELLVSVRFDRQRQLLTSLLLDTSRRFQDRKLGQSAVDFQDLESLTIGLLETNPALAERLRARYDQILMDEVQDTNPPQWRLMKLLRRPGRFFAVGDINQAIYGFRHARPEGFRELRAEVLAAGGVVDQLRENFRSRPPILECAEYLVGDAAGIEPPQLVAARQFADTAPAVERFQVDEGQFAEEAARAAARAADFYAEGFAWRDIAMLFRTMARIGFFEEALTQRGIPYRVSGGQTFYQQPEVADLLAWLRLLADPGDAIALVTVVRSRLGQMADWPLPLLVEPGGSPSVILRDSALWRHLDEQRMRIPAAPPDLLIAETLDRTRYWDHLTPPAAANVEKLLRLIRDEWSRYPRALRLLVDHFERRRLIAVEANAPSSGSPDAVSLMTMHAAKGLEFPVVFLPALDLRGQNDAHDLMYSAEYGLGGKWRVEGDSRRDRAVGAMVAAASERDKQEANRLLFVAVTRAERRLVLSCAAGARRAGFAALLDRLPVGFA